MLSSIMTHAALLLGAQAATMPPTPEQMAPQLKSIPRCVPPPAAMSARGATSAQEVSRADRIADAIRHAQERFPNTRCQERISK